MPLFLTWPGKGSWAAVEHMGARVSWQWVLSAPSPCSQLCLLWPLAGVAGPCELVQPSSRVVQPACGRYLHQLVARLEVGIEGKAGVGGAGGQPVSTEAENYKSS